MRPSISERIRSSMVMPRTQSCQQPFHSRTIGRRNLVAPDMSADADELPPAAPDAVDRIASGREDPAVEQSVAVPCSKRRMTGIEADKIGGRPRADARCRTYGLCAAGQRAGKKACAN